jgi:hypothetical protein
MTRLSTYTIAAIATLTLAMVARSSGSDGGGSQPAAATGDDSGLMLDTPEYKAQQQFPLDLELTSTVFTRIRRIPTEYTCTKNYWYPPAGADARYGEEKSPPLVWTAGPEDAQVSGLKKALLD